MGNFAYTARNSEGKIVRGIQDAATENDAINMLQAKNLLVIKIESSASSGGRKAPVNRGSKKRRVRVKSEDVLFFAAQTGTLLEAGVPVLRAIEVGAEQTESRQFQKVLNEIRESIKAGSTLRDSIARHPRVFPPLWSHLIEAGESSGNLPLALAQLSSHLEASMNLNKKVISALVYPGVLFVTAIGAIIVFMLKIIPVFARLFENFHADLPVLTQAIIHMSNFTQRYFIYMVGSVAVTVFFMRRYLRTVEGKILQDRMSLKLPIFGGFIRDSVMARSAVTLASLIKSGVSITKSLEITAHASGNILFENAFMDILAQVQQGKPLAACFREHSLFPSVVVQLVSIGEESGRLPDMVMRVAKYYEDRVEVFVSRLSVLIEPAILIIVGGLVGVIVVAMFLPIFSLSSIVK